MTHKHRLFSSLVLSIYTYAMETWAIDSKMLAKISGTYTQMVRYVKDVRVYSAASAVPNARLLQDFDYIEDILLKRRLQFAGHCQRSSQPVADLLLAIPPIHCMCPDDALTRAPMTIATLLRDDAFTLQAATSKR